MRRLLRGGVETPRRRRNSDDALMLASPSAPQLVPPATPVRPPSMPPLRPATQPPLPVALPFVSAPSNLFMFVVVAVGLLMVLMGASPSPPNSLYPACSSDLCGSVCGVATGMRFPALSAYICGGGGGGGGTGPASQLLLTRIIILRVFEIVS